VTYAYAVVLALANAFFVFLNILGLPGNWFMLGAAALLAWWQWKPGAAWGDQMFHPATLLAALALAVLGEVLEFVLGAAGSKKAGGTWRGATGAILGGIVGGIVGSFAIPIPLVGSLIGACLGAFAGASAGELSAGAALRSSLASGKGAAVGRFWGTVSKIAVGVAMWIVLTAASFVP
jgi:uncharacterized protein YqgC (DUF456 family)